jgi:hypothetical protein
MASNHLIFDTSLDYATEDMSEVLSVALFLSMVQGITNICIDSSLSVYIKYKMLGCVYDSSHTYTLTFPESTIMTELLQQFFAYSTSMIGQPAYIEWCNKYKDANVTAGRKRKIADDKIWLLSLEQEGILLTTSGYMKTVFDISTIERADKIRKAFTVFDKSLMEMLEALD